VRIGIVLSNRVKYFATSSKKSNRMKIVKNVIKTLVNFIKFNRKFCPKFNQKSLKKIFILFRVELLEVFLWSNDCALALVTRGQKSQFLKYSGECQIWDLRSFLEFRFLSVKYPGNKDRVPRKREFS
jgi:hypothetical protein